MDRLDRIVATNTNIGGDRMSPVDAFGEIHIRHFIHLMDAAHHKASLDVLTESIVELIRTSGINVSDYGCVFSPKLGNVLLGKAVADSLELHSGFVRRSVLMGKFVETRSLPGSKALLIDDVSSEGMLLSHCIRDAAEDGFTIDAVFTVVDRLEGDATALLKREHGIELRSCRSLNDDGIDALLQLVRNMV